MRKSHEFKYNKKDNSNNETKCIDIYEKKIKSKTIIIMNSFCDQMNELALKRAV
jgi:hypothetical protein